MSVRIHGIRSYEERYEFMGYYNNNYFVISINSLTHEIFKFQYAGKYISVNLQNYLYECCLCTLQNQLLPIQKMKTAKPSKKVESVSLDMVQEICNSNGQQRMVDMMKSKLTAA